MKQITFHCETITPMFLAGADGKTPELRPSAVKGALRFWWRAMNSNLSNEALLQEEEQIFGGVRHKAIKSPLLVSVSHPKFETIHPKSAYEKEVYDGIAYLFYSMIHFGNGREGISPGTKFDIVLRSRSEEVLKKGAACMWLLAFLGGIGSRARRGGGNFYVNAIDDNANLLDNSGLRYFPIENEIIDDFLKSNYLSLKTLLHQQQNGRNLNEFSNLVHSKLYTSPSGKDDWRDILNEFGSNLKNFRLNENNRANLKWFESAAFGLPVRHKNFNVTPLNTERRASPLNTERRASSLIFRIVKFRNSYYWIICHLNGDFLKKNHEGNDIETDRKQGWTKLKILDAFLNHLQNKSTIILQ